jgi:hypothetical protein
MSSSQKRSPIDRSMPLRSAGDSASEQIGKVLDDEVLWPLLFAVMTVMMAAMEWFRYLRDARPTPYLFTIVAVISCAYFAYKLPKIRSKLKQLRLGRDGERLVANYLEDLRVHGFSIFHDIPSGDANVDHIIVGTKGIFTIETKTLQKPLRGECKIRVANGKIYENGKVLPRNPIIQARAQERWLNNFLAESKFQAKAWPMVVFPGWFVEPFDTKVEKILVVEPKQLIYKMNKLPERYSPELVSAIVSSLRSHIRAQLEISSAIK